MQGDRRRGLVVEMVDDPGEVSHPITVGVVEVPWVDLVDDRGLPPRLLLLTGRPEDWSGGAPDMLSGRAISGQYP